MEFMVVICKNCSQNFFNLKLGEKLANLINYSLDVYTGKRGTKLKIKNMKDYEFDPKFILINIIRIYNSFFTYDEFYEFVVCDERSFRITNFEKVLKIHKKGKISQIGFDEIKIFEKMIEKLRATDEEMKSKKVLILLYKISYDDAPDHFLDSITTELMEDPVQLPSSQQVVDRNTIEKHLHSDPTDPFNRSKLTKDMLIPLPELRMEIEEYKKSKQKK
jgi:ubiquitin conjugation factor E4 B